MEELDFISAVEKSRKHINTWVAEKTEGKIAELLSPGTVDSLTKLVLVNAIYFKGNWDKQFRKENTKERPFKVSKASKMPWQRRFSEQLLCSPERLQPWAFLTLPLLLPVSRDLHTPLPRRKPRATPPPRRRHAPCWLRATQQGRNISPCC
ncbi:hypothetical protein P7K49_007462 [Saguinus oedipus]|uniref:Serpin domain-containing protein n=1 Tax=Saguinus oedipus TaxID=9490 RepID=A0ABQ9VVM3_SAGOE|nr:hypothetical protein P7K49_007462 [Saguinus oedipus]